MFKQILTSGIVLTFLSFAYAQEESITITTYYPSPYGSYKELRAQRMAIGATYYSDANACWDDPPGSCPAGATIIPSNANLIVEGNLGIGTTSPTSKLYVNGTFTATGAKNFEIDLPILYQERIGRPRSIKGRALRKGLIFN